MSSKHLDVDDDVDELDGALSRFPPPHPVLHVADVLQEFNNDDAVQNSSRIGSSGRLRHNTTVDAPPIPTGQRPAGPSALDPANNAELGAAFARELAKEMEDYLLRAFSSTNPLASGSDELTGEGGKDGSEKSTIEMENFMREIGIDPSTFPTDGTTGGENGEGDPEKAREAEEMFKRLWEAMDVLGESGQGPEIDGAKTGQSSTEGSTSQDPTTKKGHDFQDVLRPVIDKMKESEESNTQVRPRDSL